MTISVFGVPVEIDLPTLFISTLSLMCTAFVYFKMLRKGLSWKDLFLATLLSTILMFEPVLHELGHVLAANYFGVTITKVTFSAEARTYYSSSQITLLETMYISLAGPAFGLIYSIVSAVIARRAGRLLSIVAGFVSVVSLMDPAINLLPFGKLDGYSVFVYIHETFIPLTLYGPNISVYMVIYIGLAVFALYVLIKNFGKGAFGH